MAILGKLLKKTIDLNQILPKLRNKNAYQKQEQTLKKLLRKAEFTAFGEHYNFTKILSEKDIVNMFRSTVAVHDYNSMFRKWWYRALNGEAYVCWPERVKYFALSSGTSEQSSKHIPVTKDTIKSIRRGSVQQILALAKYELSSDFYQKGILMLGGSTHLNYNGTYYSGDLSGITAINIPFWFQHFYKPGRRIAREREWNNKLDEMVLNAKSWDIGIICGVPAWVQILFEKIIAFHNVKTIHDIWPNLEIYIWGGVVFKPYKKSFEKLLGREIKYLETYLASEGFIAFQKRPNSEGIQLLLDNGIFFEFVPFTSDNFDSEGTILPNPTSFILSEVDNQTEYAILISTCSGAWRYLIGDTIKFTDVEKAEIKITGRTKLFLSLCGEHLSQDNMNRAIELVADQFNIGISEYTVAGLNYENLFAHHWYLGTNDVVDKDKVRFAIDEFLKTLNDDYRVERMAGLKEIFIDLLPNHVFNDWMRENGKEGGQHKFPRVIKTERYESWKAHVLKYKLENSIS